MFSLKFSLKINRILISLAVMVIFVFSSADFAQAQACFDGASWQGPTANPVSANRVKPIYTYCTGQQVINSNLDITSSETGEPAVKITHDASTQAALQVLLSSGSIAGYLTRSSQTIIGSGSSGVTLRIQDISQNPEIQLQYATGSTSDHWSIYANTSGSDEFRIWGGGSDRFTILQNGNVGIGVNDPDATLEINGSLKIVDGTQSNGYVLTSDADGLASWADLNALGAGRWTLNGTTLYPDDYANWNIAIGANAMVGNEKFYVNGLTYLFNGTGEDLRVGRNANEHISFEVQDTNAYIDYEQDSDSNAAHHLFIRNNAQGTGQNDIRFVTNGSERLTIADSSGNIGIKTNSPSIDLAVGDSDTGLEQISDGNLGLYSNNSRKLLINPYGSEFNDDVRLNMSTDSGIKFYPGEGTNEYFYGDNDYDLFYHNNSGDVLTVYNQSSENNINPPNEGFPVQFHMNTDFDDSINVDDQICLGGKCVNDWDNVSLYWTLDGNNLHPINDSWRVGIGTNSPDKPLHIVNSTPTFKQTTTRTTGGVAFNMNELEISNGNGTQTWFRQGILGNADSLAMNYFWMDTGDTATPWSDADFVLKQNGDVGIGTVSPNAKLHVVGDVEANGNIRTTYNRALPNLRLDSSSSGDNWTSQGAYISLGESASSGYAGSAALHLTYRGDGYGWIGAGAVTNAVPAGGYWQFDYNSKDVYTDSSVHLNSSDLYMSNNKSIRIDSAGTETHLIMGNYASTGFNYGEAEKLSLAVEGDIKGDRLCIEEDCRDTWGAIGGESGWTDDGAVVRLTTASDQVGVGTASPSSGIKLTVQEDSSGNKDLSIRDKDINNSAGASMASLGFGDNYYGFQAKIEAERGASASGGDYPTNLNFYTTPDGSASPSKVLSLTYNGYTRLHNAAGPRQWFVREDTSTAAGDWLGQIMFDSTDGGLSTVDAPVVLRAYASESQSSGDKGGYLDILTKPTNRDSGQSAYQRVRFDQDGTTKFANDIYLRDGDVDSGDYLVRIYDSSDDGIIDVYRNNSVVNRLHGNGASFITGGNFGIGTVSPYDRLSVAGGYGDMAAGYGWTFRSRTDQGLFEENYGLQLMAPENVIISIDSNNNDTGNVFAVIHNTSNIYGNNSDIPSGLDPALFKVEENGNATANGYYIWSDERLKNVQGRIDKVLAKLKNINPVYFYWKSNTQNNDLQIGLVAQELEKEFPELVSTDQSGLKSVAYDKLSVILLAAMQEQQAQLDNINERLEKLEKLLNQ